MNRNSHQQEWMNGLNGAFNIWRSTMDKVSIEQLAEAASGMPPVAFSRLFRSETDLTPVEYLSNVRMNRAKQILNKKNSRVKKVAAAVGFRSEFYFSRMFQRMAPIGL